MLDNYIGSYAQDHRGILSLTRPIQRGMIVSWDDAEKLLNQTIQEFRINTLVHPFLFTEPSLNPKSHRKDLTEFMFETYQIPLIYFMPQSICSLYAGNLLTATIVVNENSHSSS